MPKPAVPSAMTIKSRTIPERLVRLAQASTKLTSGPRGAMARARLRASCFHIAAPFSTTVTTADPWMTWISRPGE